MLARSCLLLPATLMLALLAAPVHCVAEPAGPVGIAAAEASAANQPAASDQSAQSYQPRVRHYYIAAENIQWNYAPAGRNRVHPGEGLGAWGEQTTYAKTHYVQYKSGAFKEKVDQPDYLGIVGPVIRGVVGDTIKVHFKNKADRPYSIHPIGTHYSKADEGADYAGLTHDGGAVKPGETHTYTLMLTKEAGPGPNDPSSVLRLYRSHVQPAKDMYLGLMGPIVITDQAHGTESGRPSDVDRGFITMFMVFDENAKGEAKEGDLMHSINGYIFGNQPVMTMKQGENVRWYVFAMGSEVDTHTPHWHGNGVMHHGRRKEVLSLLPTVTRTVDMHAVNPGTWLFKCNIGDHVSAGMMSLYKVEASRSGTSE